MKIRHIAVCLLAMTVLLVTGCTAEHSALKAKTQTRSALVKSTPIAVETWNPPQQFDNVIGSTGDPLPNGFTSWIQVYRTYCNNNPGNLSATNNTCAQNAIGGHVVKHGSPVAPAVGAAVYIVPICTAENNQQQTMTVGRIVCAVKMSYRN